MPLTEIELAFCRRATQELLDCPLCYAFASPIDPSADWAADYFRIISKPMDLSTVLSRLDSNHYRSVSDWFGDLGLIWQNAMTFNPRQSFLFSIADFMQKKCERKYAKIPRSATDLILFRLDRAHRELAKVLAFELPTYSQVPRVPPQALEYSSK
jgi:hypothetical protein